jgi:hypothetical protein
MIEIKYMNTAELAEIARNTPRRHETLPTDLLADVERIKRTLDDVYPMSLDDWIDGFLRDRHPENEVRWWVKFCALFTVHAHGQPPVIRKEIFKTLLTKSFEV